MPAPYAAAAARIGEARAAMAEAVAYRATFMGNRAREDRAAPYLRLAAGYAELAELQFKLFREMS